MSKTILVPISITLLTVAYLELYLFGSVSHWKFSSFWSINFGILAWLLFFGVFFVWGMYVDSRDKL